MLTLLMASDSERYVVVLVLEADGPVEPTGQSTMMSKGFGATLNSNEGVTRSRSQASSTFMPVIRDGRCLTRSVKQLVTIFDIHVVREDIYASNELLDNRLI